MRILIVTSYYHPVQTPNVYRWGSIAEYWNRNGMEVHLLCSKRNGFPNEDKMEGLFVHRAGHNTLMDLLYHYTQKKSRRSEAGTSNPKNSNNRKWLEKIVDWTWRSIYWPDGSMLWYFPARRRLKKLLNTHDFDAIISVGLPFTAHLIAWNAKSLQPRIKWLVDIEDPFSYSKEFFVNNFFLYESLNIKVEQKLLVDADAISVTVAAAKSKYVELFPELVSKIQVTPPLFDLTLKSPTVQKIGKDEVKSIAYFGAFYDKIRTPFAFLKLLQSIFNTHPNFLKDYSFHFYGRIDQEAQSYFDQFPELAPFIHLHGLIKREEVEQKLMEVDFLLNISNKTTYHLPSKSADYLMSGKPIINICYNEEDTFKTFFNDYPNILNLNLKEDHCTEEDNLQLINFLQHPPYQKVDQSIIQQLGKPYQLHNIAHQYLKLIQ